MNGAFYIGAIGLDAQQRALDVVANNIANINTPAFKRGAVRFSELVAPARDIDDMPVALADGSAVLAGATVSATPRVWVQGNLIRTAQPLDIAISGEGFIELLGLSGHSLLWRGGTLKVDSDGLLATADGTVLRSQIAVPANATALTIAADGTVSAITDASAKSETLGQIELVQPASLDDLVDNGSGYFESIDPTGVVVVQPGEDGMGTFVQGSLEGSNVQLSEEMTALLIIQRAYGANAQVVQAGDQLMAIVNGLRR